MEKSKYIEIKHKDFKNWAQNDVRRWFKGLYENREQKGFTETIEEVISEVLTQERMKQIAEKNNCTLETADLIELQDFYRKEAMRYCAFYDKHYSKALRVIDGYKELLNKAQEIAQATRVKEEYWCGSAFVYIDHNHELGKALRVVKGALGSNRNHWSKKIFDCQLPIKYFGDDEGYAQGKNVYEAKKSCSPFIFGGQRFASSHIRLR
jgi:hypothetical protein